MDAVDALNEIAFWLERQLAPTFKVQAFRKAAVIIRDFNIAALEERVADGRLAGMKGIGGRTFDVISQAIGGRVPDYLENLRTRGAEPLVQGGGDLIPRLRGDLHSHSEWSDGGTSIELMARAARSLGREYLALTDHSPTLTIANGLTADRLDEQLAAVARVNEGAGSSSGSTSGSTSGSSSGSTSGGSSGSFRLLAGIEVDILESGELDQTPAMLGRLDIVVASVHSKLRADSDTMTRRMLGAIADPHTNVLGHCTGRMVQGTRGTRPPSEFDSERIFAECAERGVAVEINSRPERQDPPDELIEVALRAGCLFSIDSDAHAPGHLDFIQYGAERAARNGVPHDRIVTTWPLERLLEWSQKGR